MTKRATIILCAAVAVFAGQASHAQTRTTQCSKADQVLVNAAVSGAKSLALSAAVAVQDDARFDRWFGKYRPERAETARAALKSTYEAIRTGQVVVMCEARQSVDCEDGTYAFVYSDRPYVVHLCRPFFDLPAMAGMRPMSEDSVNGTREGTIIHEMTHFQIVAGTEDNCYSRIDCSDMARVDTGAVIENADSFQYFAEDVAFFGLKSQVKSAQVPLVETIDVK